MNIEPKHLLHAWNRAIELTDQYKMYSRGPNPTEKNVSEFRRYCEGTLSKTISLFERDVGERDKEEFALWGTYVQVSPDEFKIVYLSALNECWCRFVVCKEMFHAILDDDESRNPFAPSQLDSFLDYVGEERYDQQFFASPSRRAEKLAEIAALEFLFPYKDRKLIIEGAKGKPLDYLDIAKRYRAPRLYVEKFLSPEWMRKFAELEPHLGCVNVKPITSVELINI